MAINTKIFLGMEVTLIGMVTVFATLFVLSFLMGKLTKLFDSQTLLKEVEKREEQKTLNSACSSNWNLATVAELPEDSKDDVLPVLTAAIAAYLGDSADEVRVVSVKQTPRSVAPWGLAGRMSIVAGRQ